jgi:ribose transport system substrate-binding protein
MMIDDMTTFERRQRIVDLVNNNMSVKVTSLAEVFDVSETTIRNDLATLEEENRLRRVRGGAVPIEPDEKPAFPGPVHIANAEAKKRIARWAADMVEDGEAIYLDASTTVLCMAPYLDKYRRLTIVTNGINVARILAENPSNTVVLIGGVVNTSGDAITTLAGADFGINLKFHSAFVSGVGFSIETGLTERHIEEARLKQTLLASANQTVALVDSSKLGKSGLAPLLNIPAISYLVTDGDADPEFVDRVREAGLNVTVCSDDRVTSYTHQAQKGYRIGFANLSEENSQIAVDVRRGLERAAQNLSSIDLIVADNRLDPHHAMQVADDLIEQQVDLVIEYQIDYKTNSLIMEKFQAAGTPVIAVDIPIVGATFFGVDNYRSGHMAGIALGSWIEKYWGGEIDALLVLIEPRAGSLPETRIHGQMDGLQEVIGPVPDESILYLDSGNTSTVSEKAVTDCLRQLPDHRHIAILSFNDDAAYGALQAARRLDREEDVAIVGQGADRIIRNEIRRQNSRIIGSTAFFPEWYGDRLLNLALKILQGKPVPPAAYTEHVFIDQENINIYYAD